MLNLHISTVAQNRQTKTLDQAFCVVMAFGGHRRYSHSKGKGIQLFAIQQPHH